MQKECNSGHRQGNQTVKPNKKENGENKLKLEIT